MFFWMATTGYFLPFFPFIFSHRCFFFSLPHSLTLPLFPSPSCFMYRHQPAIAKSNDFQRCQTDVILVVFKSHKYSHYSMRKVTLNRACASQKLVLIDGISSWKYPIEPPIVNLMFWEVGFIKGVIQKLIFHRIFRRVHKDAEGKTKHENLKS